VRGFSSGFRLQLWFYRNNPNMLIPLVTGPLFTTIFSMVLRHGGRQDLSGYAVIAPFYMSLWWFALFNGGWVIQTERWQGTVDYLIAAPVSFASVVVGRISTTMIAGAGGVVRSVPGRQDVHVQTAQQRGVLRRNSGHVHRCCFLPQPGEEPQGQPVVPDVRCDSDRS
jgi:hypothetical protein